MKRCGWPSPGGVHITMMVDACEFKYPPATPIKNNAFKKASTKSRIVPSCSTEARHHGNAERRDLVHGLDSPRPLLETHTPLHERSRVETATSHQLQDCGHVCGIEAVRAWVAERSETNVSSGASARSGLRPSRGQGVRGRVLGRERPSGRPSRTHMTTGSGAKGEGASSR